MDDRWLTIEQAMTELAVCRRTIFNLIRRGRLTRLKSPAGRKRTYFSADQVRSLAKPLPFDPGSVSEDEMRRINDDFEKALQVWLNQQPNERDEGR